MAVLIWKNLNEPMAARKRMTTARVANSRLFIALPRNLSRVRTREVTLCKKRGKDTPSEDRRSTRRRSTPMGYSAARSRRIAALGGMKPLFSVGMTSFSATAHDPDGSLECRSSQVCNLLTGDRQGNEQAPYPAVGSL